MRATRAVIHLGNFRRNIGIARERMAAGGALRGAPRSGEGVWGVSPQSRGFRGRSPLGEGEAEKTGTEARSAGVEGFGAGGRLPPPADSRSSSCPLLCVPVKANAYGHGAVETARAALEEGAAFLAVAAVSEAACLRAAGIDAPLLLLSPALPEELPELAALELRPFVSCANDIDVLNNAAAGSGKRLPVHLKIDTGMGRVGCAPEEAEGLARRIAGSRRLFLEGTATHLSAADSPAPDDMRWTARQLARFREAAGAIRAAGVDPGILHAANSGALVFHPEALFDMARPGIALYGYSPVPEHPLALPVTPVMELRSAAVFIKRARRGEMVSYGRTWTAPEDTFIATVPVGYGDGLPRRLGGAGFSVLVGGEKRPVVGRVCMDQFMVDLGPETRVKRGDPMVIFGPGTAVGDGSPDTAADIARLADTIPYEITTAIASRVPRVYED